MHIQKSGFQDHVMAEKMNTSFVVSQMRPIVLGLDGPGGIRTHDLGNANAVSYQTRRPALSRVTISTILIRLTAVNDIILHFILCTGLGWRRNNL
jgi:hypothetical protein